jgi:hypothetical protein
VTTDMATRAAERCAKSQRDRGAHGKAANAGNAPAAARRSGDRWATLNTFVDVIAPRLTLAERAVWLVMFRFARAGVCDTSERAIATQAAINKVSAGRALRRLVELRLVWPMFKSSYKGTSSRYGIHPRPADCLPAAIAADDARRQAAHKRREDRGGDRRGRHPKPNRTG